MFVSKSRTFSFVIVDVMMDLYNWINPKTMKHSPMISKVTMDIINDNSEVRSYIIQILKFINAVDKVN